MILDLASTSKGLYAFNQVKFKLIYSSDPQTTSLYIREFRYRINTLTLTKSIYKDYSANKADIHK